MTHNIASQNNDKNRSNQFLPRKRKREKGETKRGIWIAIIHTKTVNVMY